MPQPRTKLSAAYWPVAAVLLFGIAASLILFFWLRKEAGQTDAQRFELLAERARQRIDSINERYQQALQQAADLLVVKDEPTESEWQLAVSRLRPDIDYPGFVEFGLVQVALRSELPDDLAALTGDDLLPTNRLDRAKAKRAQVFVDKTPLRMEVKSVVVPRGVTQPHGIGLPGDSILKEKTVINRVIVGHEPRMTRKRVVLRTTGRGSFEGTTLVLPLANPTLGTHWSSNIWQKLEQGNLKAHSGVRQFVSKRYGSGVVYASFYWPLIMKPLLSEQSAEASLNLYSAADTLEKHWLGGSENHPPIAQAAELAAFRTNHWVAMFGSKWNLTVNSTPLFEKQSTAYRAWVALIGGFIVTMLTAGLLGVQVRGRLGQEKIAGELRRAVKALEEARQERDTLSRDLHDGAIQSLYALQLGLSRVIDDASGPVPKVAARLEDHQHGITGVIGELREYIISHERNPASSRCDLARALTGQVERLRKLGASEFLLKIQTDAAQALTSEQAIQVASIAREALSNSMRHGAPRKVTLRLERKENAVIFRLEDDGSGFDPQEASSRGMGLVNMQTRAQSIGANLQIVSNPGLGTSVELHVPITVAGAPQT